MDRQAKDKWERLMASCMSDLSTSSELYVPTQFWDPGVAQLMDDFYKHGIDKFKEWPCSSFWFYPKYGQGYTREITNNLWESLGLEKAGKQNYWFERQLSGAVDAYRDFDIAMAVWNKNNWDFDFDVIGESSVGMPPQVFSPKGRNGPSFGKSYLTYLLCLSALSNHLDFEPKSFIEIGGGFGALGEIVLKQNKNSFYMNVDIPPLVVISSYYLKTLFGDGSVLSYDDSKNKTNIEFDSAQGALRGGCVPSWEIEKISGPFDVFFNSYSFQEMEPNVVKNYIKEISRIGVKYIASLNSVNGKPKSDNAIDSSVGVIEQVTSEMIISEFETHGYELCGRYRRPLFISEGELVILRSTDLTSDVQSGAFVHTSGARDSAFEGVWPSF